MCCSKLLKNKENYLACPDQSCGFVHFNNPIPVVAGIVLMHPGIVIVQRKFGPHVGEWCLPCGYVEHKRHPPDEVIREIKEEAGIDARVTLDIGTINPNPGKGNQIITFYLCEYVQGGLHAGSDALAVMQCTTPDMVPKLCFSSHDKILRDWWNVIDWA
ncbi:MAG: ADP-ribose pyrophosphatase [Parcubacteria group bacterium Greene0416_14]|nr:MAG: ADP-ribose pyrophosphatase [Parcubacteria group bacterium Greene0416_14]